MKYLDYLRISATIFVILIHVSVTLLQNEIGSFNWIIGNIFDGLSRICVPIFVMISGRNLLDKNYTLSAKKLAIKVTRLIIAFLFWSVFYSFVKMLIKMDAFSFHNFLDNLGCYHLWFLPMIVSLYLITPLLRKVVENRSLEQYFILLCFFFNFLIPIFFKIPFFSDFKSYYDGSVYMYLPLGYTGYYLLGHYLDNLPLKKKYFYISIGMTLFGALSIILGTHFVSIKRGELIFFFYDYLNVFCLIYSCAFFYLFRFIFSQQNEPQQRRLLTNFSNLTFGVYLIHPLILMIFNKIGFTVFLFNSVLSVPIITLSVLILSVLASALLNTIPYIKKYIV